MEPLHLRRGKHLCLGGILEVGKLGKRCRQQFRQGSRNAFDFDEQVCSAVFPEQLPAASTWCDVRVIADADDGEQSTPTAHVQFAEHRALGAQRESIRSVLDVATGDDTTVIYQPSYAHAEF